MLVKQTDQKKEEDSNKIFVPSNEILVALQKKSEREMRYGAPLQYGFNDKVTTMPCLTPDYLPVSMALYIQYV